MIIKGAAPATRALSRPDPTIRLYVLAGPDEAGSRALVDHFAKAMGDDVERIDLTSAALRDTPTRLADEAASISLFGGRTWISVSIASGGGDEWLSGCETLLEAGEAGNPVVIVGGTLTAKSKLTRLAEKHPAAIAVVSYPPEGADADRLVGSIAETLHLTLARDVARAVADACSGDRAVMTQELTKLALYLDTASDAPRHAELPDWHAIGADTPEEDIGAAVNIILDGKLSALPVLFAELTALNTSEIRLVRSIATRALLLARLRSEVDGGTPVSRVMEGGAAKAVFWKERDAVARQVRQWDSVRLARLIDRMHALERALKAPDNVGMLLMRQELLTVAMQAATTR